jgi:hypothetical protein
VGRLAEAQVFRLVNNLVFDVDAKEVLQMVLFDDILELDGIEEFFA